MCADSVMRPGRIRTFYKGSCGSSSNRSGHSSMERATHPVGVLHQGAGVLHRDAEVSTLAGVWPLHTGTAMQTRCRVNRQRLFCPVTVCFWRSMHMGWGPISQAQANPGRSGGMRSSGGNACICCQQQEPYEGFVTHPAILQDPVRLVPRAVVAHQYHSCATMQARQTTTPVIER